MKINVDTIKEIKAYDENGNLILVFHNPLMKDITINCNTQDIYGYKSNQKICSFEGSKEYEMKFACKEISVYEPSTPVENYFQTLVKAIGEMGVTAEQASEAMKELTMKIAHTEENNNRTRLTEPVLEEITEEPNEKSDLEFFDGNFDFYKPLDFTSPLFDFE